MTQELILGVLLTGLVGLVWVMTLAIVDDDHQPAKRHEPGTSAGHRDDTQHQDSELKRHTIAA
jgi:hypothetical protein